MLLGCKGISQWGWRSLGKVGQEEKGTTEDEMAG